VIVGLLIRMSLIRMPFTSSYWQTSQLYRNQTASRTMIQNSFQISLRMWHFGDNHQALSKGVDDTYKIRRFLYLLMTKFARA